MALLRDVVVRRLPMQEPRLETLGAVPLTEAEREGFREAVLKEFLDVGLGADDEPNAQGLVLETIVDDLGHL
ncbi:MAG: hypothetical protein JWQ20_2851 [Conexibacter sp.]|nr:hypothetical protein [Conexibacter sp.]